MLFYILKNKQIGYADDSTLMIVAPSAGVRVAVAESLTRDLGRVSEWCDLWLMKLNASKPKTMTVLKSCTMHNQSRPLTIVRTILKESEDLVILGVPFVSKMANEKHLRSVSRAASQRFGILKKSWRVYNDRSLLGRCFRGFILPVLEYCSAVWCSAADIHLKQLDRAVSGARFLTGAVFVCGIAHRRFVAVLCMLYKIRCTLGGALPGPYVPVRVTRGALVAHRYTYAPPCCRTSHYSRTFIRLSVSLWNDLANSAFDGVGLACFKSRANFFYWPMLLYPYSSLLLFFPFSFFIL